MRLDGGGYGIALLGDCAEQLGRKPEILERRIDETLLMVYQEEDVKELRSFLKTAPEIGPGRANAPHTGSGGCAAIEKFGELERNREEACNANRMKRNRNLGAHYTGDWEKVLAFRGLRASR